MGLTSNNRFVLQTEIFRLLRNTMQESSCVTCSSNSSSGRCNGIITSDNHSSSNFYVISNVKIVINRI